MKSRVESLTEKLLYEYAPYERAEAAQELGALMTPLAVPSLIRALGDEQSSVRRAASEALAKYGEATLAAAVLSFIEGNSTQPLRELRDARALAPILHLVALGKNSKAEGMTVSDFMRLQYSVPRVCKSLGGDVQPWLTALREEQAVIEAVASVGRKSYMSRSYSPNAGKWVELLFVRVLRQWHPDGARETLLDALGSPHDEVVESAGDALASLGDTQSAPLVGRVLKGEAQAFAELVKMRDSSLALSFLRCLKELYLYQKIESSVEALRLLRDARAVEAIQTYLEKQDRARWNDDSVAWEIVKTLCELGGEEIIPYLIELQDNDWEPLQEAAANSLKKFGGAAVSSLLKAVREGYGKKRERLGGVLCAIGEPAVPAMIELIYDDRDYSKELAVSMAREMGGLWPAAMEIVLALQSGVTDKRLDAVLAARRLPRRYGLATVAALTPLLSDSSPDASGMEVVRALHQICDISSVPALLDALGRTDDVKLKERYILHTIANLWREAESIVRESLCGWSAERRRGAARVLALIPRRRTLNYSEPTLRKLREALSSKDAEVRFGAAKALGRMRDSRSAIPLLALLADSSDKVRAAVTFAFENLLSLHGALRRLSRPQPAELSTYAAEVFERGALHETSSGFEGAGVFFDVLAELCMQKADGLPLLLDLLEGLSAEPDASGPDGLQIAGCLAMHLAHSTKRRGETDAAVAILQQLVAGARAGGAPQAEWRALHSIGELYAAGGDDQAAFESFRQAIEVIDRLWFALFDEGELRHFFKNKALLYDRMVQCCLRLGYDALALEYGEKAKTRYLGDLIARRQFPRRRQLGRVAEEFWSAVERARQTLGRGRGASSEGADAVTEVVGASWGRPAAGSAGARPARLAELEDYLGGQLDQSFMPPLEGLWQIASRVGGAPAEEEIRARLEDLYQALRPMLDSFESGSLQLTVAERTACLQQYRDAARGLARCHTSPEVPVWMLQEMGDRWLQALLEDLEGRGQLGILPLRAFTEALNVVLRHEPVYAVPGVLAGGGEQLILHLGEAGGRTGKTEPARGAADIVETVASSHIRTSWKYVEMIARGQAASFREIQSLTDDKPDAAVLQFYVTEHGTVTYLIRQPPKGRSEVLPARGRSPELQVFTAPGLTLRRLERLLLDKKTGWFPAQERMRETRSARFAFRVLHKLLESLYEELFAPIDARLRELGVSRLLLVPHRALQVLPLHALCRREGGTRRYLLDDYDISFAPSGTLAQIALERHYSGRRYRRLVAVENPADDSKLSAAAYEVGCVAERFPGRGQRVLRGRRATLGRLTRLIPGTYFHTSCHARYVWDDPLESALHLARDERLSVGALFEEQLSLAPTRLACLSACETRMTDPQDLADEYIGVSGGFLFAGAASVISTFWGIYDLSSALLIDRFYSQYLPENGNRPPAESPAAALSRAQRWLRDSTVADILRYLKDERASIPESLRQPIIRQVEQDDPDERPFEPPYFWAPFAVSSPLF